MTGKTIRGALATTAAAFAATLAAGLTTAAPLAAQETFQWSGTLRAGQVVEIRGINGAIRAVASSDRAVHVEAEKTARRSDPSGVRIEVVEHAGGVTICALYPTPEGDDPNECRPGGGRNSSRNNDVNVDFVVRVPSDVQFAGHTVNGGIEATALGSAVRANTVNGGVTIVDSRVAEARTVNGSLTLRLSRAPLDEVTELHTVNGRITLELPANVDADLHASTVNGSIESDFPVTVTGKFGPKNMRGTLGSGGPDLRLSTVNGGIQLRRI